MNAVVAIAGVGMFAPGYPNIATLVSGEANGENPPPTGELLDKRNRRRASVQTKAIADAYNEALTQSGLDAATVASVFGSALGEAATMIGLLDQMWRGEGMLSPMRFATSVHNAAAGVVSIATGNRGFTTSMGADHDTPAMAIIEAIAIVRAHDAPVIVACSDEAAPEGLVQDGEGWTSLTAAVALVPATGADPALPRMSMPEIGQATMDPLNVSKALAVNPVIGLLDLAGSVAHKRSGVLRLDRGMGRGYCVELSSP